MAQAASADPILLAMGHDPADVDTLLQRTGLNITQLNSQLTALELKGCVARLNDGRWQQLA
jgi:DNA processing protein